MKSTVGEKGQVTIPKRLRDSLAIGPGTQLEFEEEHGKLVARRVVEPDPLSALVGLLSPMDVDATVADLRGPQWNEQSNEKRRGHRAR